MATANGLHRNPKNSGQFGASFYVLVSHEFWSHWKISNTVFEIAIENENRLTSPSPAWKLFTRYNQRQAGENRHQCEKACQDGEVESRYERFVFFQRQVIAFFAITFLKALLGAALEGALTRQTQLATIFHVIGAFHRAAMTTLNTCSGWAHQLLATWSFTDLVAFREGVVAATLRTLTRRGLALLQASVWCYRGALFCRCWGDKTAVSGNHEEEDVHLSHHLSSKSTCSLQLPFRNWKKIMSWGGQS